MVCDDSGKDHKNAAESLQLSDENLGDKKGKWILMLMLIMTNL